jgi:kynurenine formamidase
MLIDITLNVTPKMLANENNSKNKSRELMGHTGTHFDVMNKAFPSEYAERRGIVFDVSHVTDRDIEPSDIDLGKVEKDMFVAFCSGYIEKEEYGSPEYFKNHPQLSDALIAALVGKGISIIGLDFAGVRRGKEHTPKDQWCADRGVFIIENLCNLKALVEGGAPFTVATYPMSLTGVTGLPCRVIAKIE